MRGQNINMKNNTEKTEKTDLEHLMNFEKVGNYTVKPWTLGQLKELYPVLMEIGAKCSEAGITLSNFGEAVTKKTNVITFIAITFGARIISGSLEIDISEAESLDIGTCIELLFAIFYMNVDFIKNSLSLVENVQGAIANSARQ